MMTMEQLLYLGADTLQKAGILEYRLDAWYLLSYCMGISRAKYYLMMHDEVRGNVSNSYIELIRRRSKREPLQYIIGEQEFMGLDFLVNEKVLIPRQDTEILVETAIKHVKGKKVLDMCTGSGCIAVSIAKLTDAESVDASDISYEALEVAQQNAIKNSVNVRYIQSDLWNNINEKYDILVSNPPYIDDEEMNQLMPEVGEHEPSIALRGGADGLDYYRRIMKNINDKILNKGLIFFEIGCRQGKEVSELLKEYGMINIKVEKDFAGLDRVVWGQMN